MENYSDSDISSESENESSQGSEAVSDCEDEPSQNLEPELSEFHDEYENALWDPDTQLYAQLHSQLQAELYATQLAQLYTDIKA
jgi:hypothetical protein